MTIALARYKENKLELSKTSCLCCKKLGHLCKDFRKRIRKVKRLQPGSSSRKRVIKCCTGSQLSILFRCVHYSSLLFSHRSPHELLFCFIWGKVFQWKVLYRFIWNEGKNRKNLTVARQVKYWRQVCSKWYPFLVHNLKDRKKNGWFTRSFKEKLIHTTIKRYFDEQNHKKRCQSLVFLFTADI